MKNIPYRSGGYAIGGGGGGVSNLTSVMAWDENTQFQNVGIALQTIVTINIPANTITKAGETFMIEFWGQILNTTGSTWCMVSFDGNDVVGNEVFALPLSPDVRNFYFKGMVTCIDPIDTFKQSGIATWSSQLNGSTLVDMVDNAGGNTITDPHQILFRCEGQDTTVSMDVRVTNFTVTFLDARANVFP